MLTGSILASDVPPEKVSWLWMDRIPRGMISIIAGRPDQGKGLFMAYLAAYVSRAGGKVLYSAIEDSFGLMTRPRLEAAGANLKNVTLTRFMLPLQVNELEAMIIEKEIDLLVIDPFAAHLSGGVNRHSDKIRIVTNPLSALIEQTGTAVVVSEHVLKRISPNSHPLQAIGGSGSGLPAASRMAFVLGVDPSDDDKRILACVKHNIRDCPPAVSFEVDTKEVTVLDPLSGELEEHDIPTLLWDAETEFDPMRLFETKNAGRGVGRPADKRADACEWLTNYLSKAGKPVPAGMVFEDAKQYGMSTKTLRRAATDMEIIKDPVGGGRNCKWDLPDHIKKLYPGDTPAPPEGQPDGPTDGGLLSSDDIDKLLGGDS